MGTKGIILLAFLGVLGVLIIALQVVKHMHLEKTAQEYAQALYSWDWTGSDPDSSLCSSRFAVKETAIVSRNDRDAVVKIKGSQTLSFPESGVNPVDNIKAKSETVDCSATLTFYREQDRWELGRAELE